MKIDQYETPLEKMIMPPRVTLPSGKIVTACSALDADRVDGFAHPSYSRAIEFGKLHGARLVSYETIDEMYNAPGVIELTPVTLPTPVQYSEHCRSFGPPPKRGTDAYRNWAARLMSPMATREWCDVGDALIYHQIRAHSWDGKSLIVNDLKWHQFGAPPGRCYLRGWRIRGRWIQAGVPPAQIGKVPGPHGDWQHDYGTGARYEWPEA